MAFSKAAIYFAAVAALIHPSNQCHNFPQTATSDYAKFESIPKSCLEQYYIDTGLTDVTDNQYLQYGHMYSESGYMYRQIGDMYDQCGNMYCIPLK